MPAPLSMRRTQQLWAAVGVLVFLWQCASRISRQEQEPGAPWGPQPDASYYAAPHRSSVTLTDGTFTFHLNLSLYQAHYPHLQSYLCQEVIPRASLCQGAAQGKALQLLLLAIKSHPASSSRRATLRRTWARPRQVGGYRVQLVFLVASTPNSRHLSLLQLESSTFRDILMWDFTESHHNLSLKEHCFLHWAHRHCRQATFILKGDDDLFVNLETLTAYLSQSARASHYIHGNIQNHSAVMRGGKYAVPHSVYPLAHYPNFASGGGFIIPGPLLPALCQASAWLPVFPLDDVYLGFLTLAAGLAHQLDSRFRVWGPPRDELKVYQESLTVHGISLEKMEEVWKGICSQHEGKD